MSKETSRVISAIVMIGLVILIVWIGKIAAISALFLVGLVVHDEIMTNFLKEKRKALAYLISLVCFGLPFLLLHYYTISFVSTLTLQLLLGVNILLLVYLFYVDMESDFISIVCRKVPVIPGFYVFLNTFVLSSIFSYTEWWKLFTTVLVVNYGMDSGAWFFGKNFGKNKLWKTVSPNKTIEGLVGGMLTSGFLGGLCFHILYAKFSVVLFFLFCLLGLLSQLGDLMQSKLKRQVGIKDSSNLIPGHGGVFDRVDSLFFLAPFFLVLFENFKN